MLPPALVGMDADTLLAPIAEGVYAVALKSGGLFLWDAGGGSEPQAIGEAAEGLVPCRLTVTPLPPSTAPPARRRVMLLAATPAPPVEEGAEPTPCGEEDAQLLVLDLAPPSVKNLEALQAGWDVAKVAELRLAAQAPAASATLSSDGSFAACVLDSGSVAIYYLPLPLPVPRAEKEKEGSKSGSIKGGQTAKEPETPAVITPQYAGEPKLILTTEALAPPSTPGALTCHFLLSPAPRAVGEALSWAAAVFCGHGCEGAASAHAPLACAARYRRSCGRGATPRVAPPRCPHRLRRLVRLGPPRDRLGRGLCYSLGHECSLGAVRPTAARGARCQDCGARRVDACIVRVGSHAPRL